MCSIVEHSLLAVLLVIGLIPKVFLWFHLLPWVFCRSGHTLTLSFYIDDISQIIKIEEGMTTDM